MNNRRAELRHELRSSVPVVVEVLASALLSETSVKLQVNSYFALNNKMPKKHTIILEILCL